MARIRDVWAPNLDAEMRNIRDAMEQHPYIAMDTEFPGVVARPIGTFKTSSEYHYQTMRCNVDLLKIIQVGITLADADGNLAETCTWQFNFRFSVNDDMYSPDSIELLRNSGIDFQRHEELGILPNDFAELMITSGMVLSDDTVWISFHSGYDFGYFLKLLTGTSLPPMEDAFFELLKLWFPTIYDIKYMMKSTNLRIQGNGGGGLQHLADDLGISRIGNSHQAGSDSLLTASTFFKVRETYFNNNVDHAEYSGKLYGLGLTFSVTNGITDPGRGGVTLAEREDRAISSRELHNQTPGGGSSVGVQNQGITMSIPMTPGIAAPLPSSAYGPLASSPYTMRTSLVGGR